MASVFSLTAVMQRWWYTQEKDQNNGKVSKSKKTPSRCSDAIKRWKFTVVVNQDLNIYEKVAVVGSCDELGNWDSDHSIILTRENGE
jgi:Starch binding domain